MRCPYCDTDLGRQEEIAKVRGNLMCMPCADAKYPAEYLEDHSTVVCPEDIGLHPEPLAVDEYSEAMCATCDIDLATCNTIWAAEGILYCSRKCGIHDLMNEYGDNAEKHFDEVAEELSPKDIGLYYNR